MSIAIKKFTDAQTGQTANNIDWITRDIDFGNPMVKKSIDAITVTYRSSAAQTTPISYAINGLDDEANDYTNLTGNMVDTLTAGINDWTALVLEFTPFECYSIKIRGRNPTNTGTMEINDISIRYNIEDEDIT